MNKKIFSVFIALFFAIFSTGAFAQDNRTLETKVADLLAQMPASDLGSRDRLIIEMVQLGPAVFQKITEQLTSPGKGDDTAARFAINSLSRYASEFGKEAIRDYAEINLLKALENHQDLGIKAFLLEQLNLVAGDKTVAVVKKYLNDDRLSEPATLVLLTARGENAAQALLDALPRAEGKNQVTLVKALGELHCVKAVSQITPLVNANNPNLKKVALASLANIADPNSFKTLYNSAKVKGFAYDATNAAEAFLNYTARLGENNETTRCKKACKAIFKANHSENLLHNYSKALAIYTENFGYVAMPLLLKAVDSNNRAFRYSALNLAVNTGGVAATREWVSKAQRASTEVKAEIISMLGRKGDPLAIDFIEDNLNATDPVVREESVTALVKLKGREAIPQLIGHLAEGKDIESTKAALLQLLDEKHLSPSAMKLTQTSGKVKAAMVDLIAAKSGKAYFGEILALTNSSDMDVKNAAFNAMKKISTEENLDDLINLLLSAMNENEITQVQRALVVAAKGVEKEKSESGKVLQALHHTDKKERIIVILPEIGGPVAMQTLTYNFNHSTGKTKEAAFEALTNWKDYSASSAFFKLYSFGWFRQFA